MLSPLLTAFQVTGAGGVTSTGTGPILVSNGAGGHANQGDVLDFNIYFNKGLVPGSKYRPRLTASAPGHSWRLPHHCLCLL